MRDGARDVLPFSCNTLHRSDQNRSDERRWTLICCYNAARNDPYLDHHHPRYTPLEKIADSEIKAAGLKFADAAQEDAFLNKPVVPAELQKTAERKSVEDSAEGMSLLRRTGPVLVPPIMGRATMMSLANDRTDGPIGEGVRSFEKRIPS